MTTAPTKSALISEHIRSQIDAGAYRPGDRLPSLRALRTQYGVSVGTVVHALHQLEFEGRIASQRKARFLVLAPPVRRLPQPLLPMGPTEGSPFEQVINCFHQILRSTDITTPLAGATLGADYLPSQALRKIESGIHRRYGADLYHYEVSPGALILRRELARRISALGPALSPDELVVTNGCLEAIQLALRATTKPGDTVVLESPTFYGVIKAAQALKLNIIEVPVRAEDGLDLDLLEQVLARQPVAAIFVTPSFNNPTGAVMSVVSRKRLARMAIQRSVAIIEDDIYADLFHSGARLPPILSLAPEANVYLCSSVSKSLAAGLRVGWLAKRKTGLRGHDSALADSKFELSIATATQPQYVVAEALISGVFDKHLAALRPALKINLEGIRTAVLNSFPSGTRVSTPTGGFLLWAELPEPVTPVWLIQAAASHGIAIVPGAAFTLSHRAPRFVRISAGHPLNDTLAAGIQMLGRIIAGHVRTMP